MKPNEKPITNYNQPPETDNKYDLKYPELAKKDDFQEIALAALKVDDEGSLEKVTESLSKEETIETSKQIKESDDSETKYYNNGDSYQGRFNAAGQRHGFGIYHSTNGNVYEGYWKNGCKHGKGKLIYANGDIYDGNWVFGKQIGHGVFTWGEGRK